jgi:hypothetical protein
MTVIRLRALPGGRRKPMRRWRSRGGPFGDLNFEKTGAEIKGKAETKIGTLREKTKERETTIQELCKGMGLETAMDVLTKMDQLDDMVSNAAGDSPEKAKLHQAVNRVRDIREEMDQLEIVIRNIDPEKTFTLSFEALEYYEF